MSSNQSNDNIAGKVSALQASTHSELRQRWRRTFRTYPPKTLSRDVLILGIAWKIQERAFGGLSATTKRQPADLARTMETKSDLAKDRRVHLKPGARLLREWDGETHEVLVTEDGFEWRDQTWRSLSVITREITGTRWSGPRFFGLDRKSSAHKAREPATEGSQE